MQQLVSRKVYLKFVRNHSLHVWPPWSQWKSIFHREIMVKCNKRFIWFWLEQARDKSEQVDCKCVVLAFRYRRTVGCRMESKWFFFFLFFSRLPPFSVGLSDSVALIAERTKRKLPYPSTIAIVVHDLRATTVIFCRSKILTYCPSWEREIFSIPQNHDHLARQSCHVSVNQRQI